jgi:hypothetical protein
MESSILTQKAKNYQPDGRREDMLNSREDDGKIVFETEQANRSLP